MSTWIAAFVAVAAIAATYVLCVRPAMRGRCATNPNAGREADTDRQIAELREELRMLRAQDSLDTGRVPRSGPAPSAES